MNGVSTKAIRSNTDKNGTQKDTRQFIATSAEVIPKRQFSKGILPKMALIQVNQKWPPSFNLCWHLHGSNLLNSLLKFILTWLMICFWKQLSRNGNEGRVWQWKTFERNVKCWIHSFASLMIFTSVHGRPSQRHESTLRGAAGGGLLKDTKTQRHKGLDSG